jgi:hypothetical protein
MSTKSIYLQKLKDPRWQKKRLKVMDRANFECEQCGSTDTPLNVHHIAYKKRAEPWEYEDNELQCLCEVCHEQKHKNDINRKYWTSEEAKNLIIAEIRTSPDQIIITIVDHPERIGYEYWSDEFKSEMWLFCIRCHDNQKHIVSECIRKHDESKNTVLVQAIK